MSLGYGFASPEVAIQKPMRIIIDAIAHHSLDHHIPIWRMVISLAQALKTTWGPLHLRAVKSHTPHFEAKEVEDLHTDQ